MKIKIFINQTINTGVPVSSIAYNLSVIGYQNNLDLRKAKELKKILEILNKSINQN